jgi:hypothetical protein
MITLERIDVVDAGAAGTAPQGDAGALRLLSRTRRHRRRREASRTLKLALPADWSQIALLYALRRQRRPGEKLAGNPYYRRNAILSRLKFHRNKRAVICPSRTCVGA